MNSVGTTQPEKGHGPIPSISSKGKKQTGRRIFLKRAGIATGALCTPGLPKLAATEPKELKEPDKSLNEEIAQLEPEEKAALVTFLKGLWEVDRRLTPDLAKCCLLTVQTIVELQKKTAKEEKAKQEECKKRASLTGPAKVDYLVSQLTENCCCYCPPFQRDVLKLIVNGKPSQSDWETTHDSKTYLVGVINRIFEGCSNSLRKKVVAQYLRDVMPALEAESKERNADQEATDELLALTEGKTPKQIRDMTALLKSSKLTS